MHLCRVVVAVIVGVILSAGPIAAQTLRIYQIDVEQADAALLVMPNGKTLLIDSGKNGHGQRIRNVMTQAGVTQIDAFVASHYHEDHYGGIDELVNAGVPVLESFDRGDKTCCLPESKKNEARFKDYEQAVGEDARTLRPGDTITLDPLVTITCIASGGVVSGEGEDGEPAAEENDMSVVLLVSFRGFKAYYGGDSEAPTEAKIAAHDLALNVDLYKASHHGSHSSSSPAFMQDLSPSVVVISNGNNDRFKHPRQVTLNTYAALTPAPVVFQTNKCLRAAPCANVPDAQIADPETTDADGTILITVDAATGSYTVQYGTTTRTFAVKTSEGPVVTTPSVVIGALLPNPVGDDEQLETVTVRNTGAASVSLDGWRLLDRSAATWTLTGTLAAGQSHTFRRDGQAMSLNNAGDEIALIDAMSTERDRFGYAASNEGVLVVTGH